MYWYESYLLILYNDGQYVTDMARRCDNIRLVWYNDVAKKIYQHIISYDTIKFNVSESL